jgi:Spy/CpxP family protein refolding chaperone
MMVAVERAPWQNPKIVSTLMLVFLAGAATGALSMRFGLHGQLHRPAQTGPENREAILNRFRAELNLSPPQTEKLALVLDDYRQYYQSLQDQLEDLRATGKTGIMQILNPEQRVKFEKMMNDLAPQLAGSGANSGTK